MSAAAVSKSGLKPITYPSHEVPREPQAFFKKVYTHITDDHDLPKALALIKMGNTEIHKGLTDKNKTMIVEWVEKGSTADKQASRFANLLKRHKEIFSGVDPDKFSQTSKGSISAPDGTSFERSVENKKETKKADASAKTKKGESKKTSGPCLSSSVSKSPLEKVKELGRIAGLTEAEVNESLEEIILPNQTTVWAIKTSHPKSSREEIFSHPFAVWEEALIRLASDKEIVLFAEGHIREDRDEKLFCNKLGIKGHGYFRGLETEKSMYRNTVLLCYESIVIMKHSLFYNPEILQNNLNLVLGECFVRRFVANSFKEAATTSKTAEKVFERMCFFGQTIGGNLTFEQIPIIVKFLTQEIPDINDWVEFIETLLPIVCKDCTSEVRTAVDTMIATFKKTDFVKGTLLSNNPKAPFGTVIEKIRGPRDLDYGKMFLQELASLPKDKPVFVMFGANHAPGFKAAVLAGQSTIEGDSKADSKKQS